MITTYVVQIAGYGRYEIEANDRSVAESVADAKRRCEGALSPALVWRKDQATKFDQLTAEMAQMFANGSGAPLSLLRLRHNARAALAGEKETK